MNNALTDAIAARTAACTKLDSAVAALTRGKEAATAAEATLTQLEKEEADWIARDARRRVERAVADEGPAPSLVPTDKAFLRKRQAEVTLAAERGAVATLEAAESEARTTLAAAQAVVAEAARGALFAEVRAEFETFRRQARELAATRELLFAAFLSLGRDALKPTEWLELDTLLGCASDLMQVGVPWGDVPINELEVTGERDRPREARARINRLIPAWQARLEELASGDATEAPEAQEAAA